MSFAVVQDLQQQGLLERAVHDALVPKLIFRQESSVEEWPANTGQTITMSKPGLIQPDTTPLQPGQDPGVVTVPYEQWQAELNKFAKSINTHIPTATTAAINTFLRNVKQLGIGGAMSVNRLARNAIFLPYLGGQTVSLTSIGTTDLTIRVASLNGFSTVLTPGSNTLPAPVTAQNPLPATVGEGGAAVAVSVTGVNPDNQKDPNGPGTLTIAVATGAAFAIRTTIRSAYCSTIVRASGGGSVDSIGPGDTFNLQMAINATALLRDASVPPHDDGWYHCHMPPLTEAQLFADPVFQRLHQSVPEGDTYQQAFVHTMAGIKFFLNQECPKANNSGNLTGTVAATGSTQSGVYASDIGAEVVNGNGVAIGYAVVTGQGVIHERRIDESQFITAAGTNGKIGEFSITNNAVQILTEGIRLILLAPQDPLQENVKASYSISTSFSAQPDRLATSGPQAYKRAVVFQYAA